MCLCRDWSFSEPTKFYVHQTELRVETKGEFAIITAMTLRGTQREYNSKPIKHSIVKRILVFKG